MTSCKIALYAIHKSDYQKLELDILLQKLQDDTPLPGGWGLTNAILT